jgi:response regulator RpfG family c-di-GMP phosphodiesterase
MEEKEILKDVTVLYAEDDTNTRESLTRMLSKIFKEVIAVEDGQLALDKYHESKNSDTLKIDMIISDINMPNMTGIDMIKHVRSYDNDIPIVLVTAHSEANYLFEAINLNVSQYAIKPVNAMLLFENLKKAYLPIYQTKLLEQKNIELERLNKKIKEVAKQELENMKYGDMYLTDEEDEIDFGDFLDNITLDEKDNY